MFKSEYDQLIRENFDLSDKTTRQYIVSLEDAGQEQLLSALSSALYDKIVTKVDDIDFGTIPMSRGDITKVEGFSRTEECLNIIRRLVIEYKQSTGVVDVVLSAIQNIKDRKAIFMKSYALNVELPMLIYNIMVLSIERSTSLMIATSMEYIKDPMSSSPKAALNKVAYQRTMDDMLFKQLVNFNNMCNNNSLDKVLDTVMKHPVKEEVEFQYGTMTPISEDEPDNPVIPSPITPGNTVDPFAEPDAPAPGFEDSKYEPVQVPSDNVDPAPEAEPELTGDTEIPAANEFPEDVPDDAPVENSEEVPEDTDAQTAPEEPTNDEVESDNIPAVVPGEDISSDDKPITEKELNEGWNDLSKGQKIATGTVATITALAALPVTIKGLGWFFNHVLIDTIRNIVYSFYYTQMKFSDFLAVQADLIEANANELQYSSNSTLSDEERTNVIKKQIKWVEKLRKWSNKFDIDRKATENKAKKEAENDKKLKKQIKKDENDEYALF